MLTAFNLWIDHVQNIKYERSTIAKIIDRWGKMFLLRAFNRWSESVNKLLRERYVLGKVLGHWTSMTKLRAFNAWLEALTDEGRMKANEKAMAAVVSLWHKRSSQANMAFAAWKIVLSKRRVILAAYHRVEAKADRLILCKCFATWVEECVAAHQRICTAMSRWNRLVIGAVLCSIQIGAVALHDDFAEAEGGFDYMSKKRIMSNHHTDSTVSAWEQMTEDLDQSGHVLVKMGASGRDIIVRIPPKDAGDNVEV